MNVLVIGDDLNCKVSASLLASVGNRVLVTEFELINKHFNSEPGLTLQFQEQVKAKRITSIEQEHLSNSEELTNLDFVIVSETSSAVSSFEQMLDNPKFEKSIIIVLSPSRIGEADGLKQKLFPTYSRVTVASVPMLIREGRAIDDFSRPENIIAGIDDPTTKETVESLFHPFNRLRNVIKFVSTKEAEFACFAGHAMLATRLSFMNEMASLAERTDVDIDIVRQCIGLDPRIGQEYLYPGCGFGGKALERNVKRVARQLRQRHDDLGLLDTVLRINDRQKELLFRKVWKFFGGNLESKIIAIWGAAFKPGTTNIEDAPSLKLIELLVAQGALIKVYDVQANTKLTEHFEDNSSVSVVESSKDAILGAEVLAICTEWKEFWSPDLNELSKNLKSKAIFDGRNILQPQAVEKYGLKYFGIGRNKVSK